jgi:signal peptidase I
VVILARASVATVVAVHGDGMAPTLLDGEHVLLVRGSWTVERGDVVVYDPRTATQRELPAAPAPREYDAPHGEREGREHIDPAARPQRDLRNTAVVDPDELDANWAKVQAKAGHASVTPPPRAYRVGRVLAVPGDTITVHEPTRGLGLRVNGVLVASKPDAPVRLELAAADGAGRRTVMVARSFETLGDRRYAVLPELEQAGGTRWPGLDVPGPEAGPVEVVADGYLVIADNRVEGACCDSRVLGFVSAAAIRGEVTARLGARAEVPAAADSLAAGTAAAAPPSPDRWQLWRWNP